MEAQMVQTLLSQRMLMVDPRKTKTRPHSIFAGVTSVHTPGGDGPCTTPPNTIIVTQLPPTNHRRLRLRQWWAAIEISPGLPVSHLPTRPC